MQLYATNLVTIYSTPIAMLTTFDGREVELLHDPQLGAHIRINGGAWVNTGLSDVDSPRLNADGWLYFSSGNSIVRVRFEDVADIASFSLGVATFPETVSIGGGEGGFDATGTYLPLRVGSTTAGVLNVQTGVSWTRDIGVAINNVQVGNGLICIAQGSGGTWRVPETGPTTNWASAVGHEDTCLTINGNPAFITTTSNWQSGDIAQWVTDGDASGSTNWMLVIDMLTETLVYKADIGWFDHHFAGAGTRIVVSHTGLGSEGWIEVHDLATSGIIHPREFTGFTTVNPDYWKETHAAISADGGRVYYTNRTDTWIINLSGATPPPNSGGEITELASRRAALTRVGIAFTEVAPIPMQAEIPAIPAVPGKLIYSEPDGNEIVDLYSEAEAFVGLE